jgi:hypothetical protein
MSITFNIAADLEATEEAIVDWKKRARDYKSKGIEVPAYIADRIAMLKKDASLLRRQLNGDNV